MAASVATSSGRTDPEGALTIPSLLMQRLLPAGVTGLRPIRSPAIIADSTRTTDVSSGYDWSGLLDRIHIVGHYIRDVKAATVDQDLSVQELLDQVRLDMKAAIDRVRAAEQAATDVQERAIRQIKAAEDRADAAEASARSAQQQFATLSRLIRKEFPSAE